MPVDRQSLFALSQLQQIRAIQTINLSSTASLALWIYDWLLTVEDERKFIWGSWQLHKRIKALFLFMRYYSLIFQIIMRVWATSIESYYPVPTSECTAFTVVGIVGPLILSNCLDFLLLLRVWILFKRTLTSFVLLTGILVLQIFIVVILVILYIPYLSIDEHCIPRLSTLFCIVSCLFNLTFQTVAWGFTIYQCRKARKFRWGQHALVALLERDGTISWLMACSLAVVATIMNTLDEHFSQLGSSWMSSLSSIAGCRMIINLQYLIDHDAHIISSGLSVDVQLTTYITTPDISSMWAGVDGYMTDSFTHVEERSESSTPNHK